LTRESSLPSITVSILTILYNINDSYQNFTAFLVV
jgi:hypothetical protein